ncbi:hypothetical protein AA0114_g5830 [Alternaria tenuissima]|uniref:Rhodopsin domain-containing protein n=1 Tax=Alternaria tenuissima TaxID=119927 RepID=A0A4Q4MGQ2_9PLEO|nr:hypothetical protein AA0114_g5830 [Alternaria tenuissima]
MSTASVYVAVPPPGHTRHAVNPPNLHKELAAVGISTTALALVAAVLQLFTRAHVTKMGIHLNDYMKSGLGYHMWEVKTEDYELPFQKWTLVGIILYATSLAFSKLSILLFYLRLSPQKGFRTLVHMLIACVIVYATVYDLVSTFGCRPIAATWDLTRLPGAVCMNQLTKYMALSVLNIVIDVITLVLPIPVVARLQMSRRRKITVCGIFATGGFVCLVAIRRTTLLKPLMISPDYTWDAVEQFQWCFAEVNAGIVCACAPALNPFFVRYVPGLLSSHFGNSKRDRDGLTSDKPTLPASNDREQADEAYGLQLRDDVSEKTATTKHSEVGDESTLWQNPANKGTEKELITTYFVKHAC